jgi:hypothetical protein
MTELVLAFVQELYLTLAAFVVWSLRLSWRGAGELRCSRLGRVDLRAQAEVPGALKTDTPR